MTRLGAICLVLAGLMSCRPAARPDGGSGLLPVGAIAPEVTSTATDPQAAEPRASLHSLRGQAAVVYFYPRDATPGCTREACAFRDIYDEYSRRGVAIFGVSQDSVQSHREFSKQHHLPFPLVADEDAKISAAYGVDSLLGFNSRVTFLVSPTGRVAHVWPDVDPGIHAKQVLKAIDDNGFAQAP